VLYELAEVAAPDGILLQGMVTPSKRKALAVIYIHGLGGDFYGSPRKADAFARECRRRGFGFFSFNNRGSGTMSGAKRKDGSPKGYSYVDAGRCYERFEDCVLDISAFVAEAKRRGYRKVALVGHSTGANKAVYYLSRDPDPVVSMAVLTGPVSDVPGQARLGGRRYRGLVALARRMAARKKGGSLMPQSAPLWPMTARRFLSLSVAGSHEDVFQYHMGKPAYRELKRVKVPLLAVLGGKDEYATMPPEDILASYRRANPLLEGAIIKGAFHSFSGKEGPLAGTVCGWLWGKCR
jgi:pimeloyl-ACP methyl ester carboxylesterase